MIFTETKLPGAYIIDVEPRADERGLFARTWDRNELEAHGLDARLAQANLAFNKVKDTLRGMHFQAAPHAEVKLVRCTRGAVWDAIVDLRRDSPTYRQWVGVELTAENRRALYVPEGFAHGYQTLEDGSELVYQVSQFYAPQAERGVRWDDPAFGIAWPEAAGPRLISAKDAAWPDHTD